MFQFVFSKSIENGLIFYLLEYVVGFDIYEALLEEILCIYPHGWNPRKFEAMCRKGMSSYLYERPDIPCEGSLTPKTIV